MINELTLDQVAATISLVIRQELKHLEKRPAILENWIHESDVMLLCKKSRRTLYRAIEKGQFNSKDIRPNPLGKGYLFRRSAIVKD